MTKVNIPSSSLPLTPTVVKTGNYTAVAGDFVPVDTTSGNVTITLPTAPADKTRIGIKMVTQGSTNTVTIARGGSDVFNKTGGATSLTLSLLNQGLIVQYQATGAIWLVQGEDLALSGLDGRYISGSSEPINVKNPTYGAKGDGNTITDVAMTSGSAVLSTATVFTSYNVGQQIIVYGAGAAAGLSLVTTIQSVNSGIPTLAQAAGTTVSGTQALYYTDDTAAIQSAINVANTIYVATGSPQTVILPNGIFGLNYSSGVTQRNGTGGLYFACALIIRSGVILKGAGNTRLFVMPTPATITTAQVQLPTATIPVASTASFASFSGFGQQLQFQTNDVVGWTGKTPTSFTGCTGGSHLVPAGTPVVMRMDTSIIATDFTQECYEFKIQDLLIDGGNTPNLTVEVAFEGISIAKARDFEISNNEICYTLGKAIHLQGGTSYTPYRFSIHNNDINNCYSNAIGYSENGASDFSITDNDIHDFMNAATGSGAESIICNSSAAASTVVRGTVARNIIKNWGTLDMAGTNMNYMHNTVAGTIVGLGGGSAVARIFNFNNLNVVSCTFDTTNLTGTGATALLVQGTGTFLNIDDITLIGGSGTTAALFNNSSGSTSVSITNSKFVSGSTAAPASILVRGTDITFTGNTIDLLSGAAPVGIGIVATNGTVTGNVFDGTSVSISGSNVSVAGNTMIGNLLVLTLTNSTITDNVLNFSSSPAIYMNLTNTDNVISNNSIVLPSGLTWIQETGTYGSDRNVIINNHIYAAGGSTTSSITGPNTICRGNSGAQPIRTALSGNGAYTLHVTDELIGVGTLTAAKTINLPAAANVPIGIPYTVQDEGGTAATHNVLITPNGSDTINGVNAAYPISVNYGSATIYSTQAGWIVLGSTGASLATNTFTGTQTAPDFAASGLTGATATSRYAGATSTGAPTSGTFAKGDFVIDQTGSIWVCTTAGTPGTWTNSSGLAGSYQAQTQTVSTSGTVIAPSWATVAQVVCIPGGYGGGGGGAAALTGGVATQVGGSGASAGFIAEGTFTITGGASYTATVGAGGAGGAGGAASTGSTGNAGSNGSAGGVTSLSGTGLSIKGSAYVQGTSGNSVGGGANSTTTAGAYTPWAASGTIPITYGLPPLAGGAASSAGGWGGGSCLGYNPGGGGGGGPANATNGGGGGGAGSNSGSGGGGGVATAATANGTAGTNATVPGGPGGGGGGGAPGGAGGNGGNGAGGVIYITWKSA